MILWCFFRVQSYRDDMFPSPIIGVASHALARNLMPSLYESRVPSRVAKGLDGFRPLGTRPAFLGSLGVWEKSLDTRSGLVFMGPEALGENVSNSYPANFHQTRPMGILSVPILFCHLLLLSSWLG